MKHVASKSAILALVLALSMAVVMTTAMLAPMSAATSGPRDTGTGTNVDGPGTIAGGTAGGLFFWFVFFRRRCKEGEEEQTQLNAKPE